MPRFDSPRLLADIGGTYARFTLELGPGEFTQTASLRCADHTDFQSAVQAYLRGLTWQDGHAQQIAHAAVAIANPVEGDLVRMTNYHWQFSIEEMRQRLGLDTLVFLTVVLAILAIGLVITHEKTPTALSALATGPLLTLPVLPWRAIVTARFVLGLGRRRGRFGRL